MSLQGAPYYHDSRSESSGSSEVDPTNVTDDGFPLHILVPLVVIGIAITICFIFPGSRRSEQEEPSPDIREHQIEQEKSKENDEARRKKLEESFEENKLSMIVKCCDLQPKSYTDIEADGSNTVHEEAIGLEDIVSTIPTSETTAALEVEKDNENDDEDGVLYLPRRMSPQKESVVNLCSICLDAYLPGETVVWSSNPKCSHAFHRDCVLRYLLKVVQEGPHMCTPCPICRQNFVEIRRQTTEEITEGDDDHDGSSY